MSVRNDDINDTSKLQLFQYRQKTEMAFAGVLIQTQAKILNHWYTRSVVHRSVALQDLICKFASEEFDDGGETSIFKQHRYYVRNANSFIL